ncbi:hypothetical protein GGX14DRAFT_594030 [Mycena pura]|uniref:Uncharacterized protein n=1 Tax=Mycena pura TaxID=153505 RepID=A0AAD6UUM3_9AGAR|nr:hypothetical protein GGX14DRAFT_594030 [Mycena pura]
MVKTDCTECKESKQSSRSRRQTIFPPPSTIPMPGAAVMTSNDGVRDIANAAAANDVVIVIEVDFVANGFVAAMYCHQYGSSSSLTNVPFWRRDPARRLSSSWRSAREKMLRKAYCARTILLHALLTTISIWPATSQAALTNITVDDTDSTAWTWTGTWNAITPLTPCLECAQQPDQTRAYNGTWHDGSARSGAFTFQGAAVYIYGIDVQTLANVTFSMNNPLTNAFYSTPAIDVPYIYDTLFFHATNVAATCDSSRRASRLATWKVHRHD